MTSAIELTNGGQADLALISFGKAFQIRREIEIKDIRSSLELLAYICIYIPAMRPNLLVVQTFEFFNPPTLKPRNRKTTSSYLRPP